jgi:hypothetical protein
MFEELDLFGREQLKKLLAIIILTDGNIKKSGKYFKAFRLITSVHSEGQHDLFRYLCEKLFDKTPKRFETIINGKTFLESDLFCVKAVKEIMKLSPSYKTSPCNEKVKDYLIKSSPTFSFIFEENNFFKWIVFRIWFDFEGSITPTFRLSKKVDGGKYVYYQSSFETQFYIACAHPNLSEELIRLCGDLGLCAKIKKDKRCWSGIGGIRITRKKDIKKIISHGPMTNVKISKKSSRFAGIEKKKICSLVKSIYENDISCSKSFKNRELGEKYRTKNYNKMLEILKFL